MSSTRMNRQTFKDQLQQYTEQVLQCRQYTQPVKVVADPLKKER